MKKEIFECLIFDEHGYPDLAYGEDLDDALKNYVEDIEDENFSDPNLYTAAYSYVVLDKNGFVIEERIPGKTYKDALKQVKGGVFAQKILAPQS